MARPRKPTYPARKPTPAQRRQTQALYDALVRQREQEQAELEAHGCAPDEIRMIVGELGDT